MAGAVVSSAKEEKMKLKKCLTPEFRMSFPKLFKPEAFGGQDAKYSCVMLFPKTTDITPLKKAAYHAAVEKFGPKEKWPAQVLQRMPFNDGDKKPDLMGYAGCTTVTAKSKDPVGLINNRLQPIMENDGQMYPGCYCRAIVIAYAYDNEFGKGVGFALQNVQKLRDGPSFSGRKAPEEEFDAVDDYVEDAEGTPGAEATFDL